MEWVSVQIQIMGHFWGSFKEYGATKKRIECVSDIPLGAGLRNFGARAKKKFGALLSYFFYVQNCSVILFSVWNTLTDNWGPREKRN